MRFSTVIPVLDEEAGIAATLSAVAEHRRGTTEVIVVDGGSRDGTVAAARPLCDRVVTSAAGRARQMNAGAAAATGEVLLFLHADTRLPRGAFDRIDDALAASGRRWGRFDVRLSGEAFLLRIVERSMNARSRLTGIATGDQAFFVTRELFTAVGGFPEIPLMEDIEMSARLGIHDKPVCLREKVTTSSRRWERNGIVRTILLMWSLRLRHFLGESPHRLAERYRR